MNLKGILVRVATVVAEEAARNPQFLARLEAALASDKTPAKRSSSTSKSAPLRPEPDGVQKGEEKRRGGRRSPAVIDPVDLAVHGEAGLRDQLNGLDLEKLLDIVAQYGMDPGKLVMKWRDRDRVIDRIVEVSLARATKGDAFRKE